MKVSELIDKLKEMPQDAIIVDLWNGTTDEPTEIFSCQKMSDDMVALS